MEGIYFFGQYERWNLGWSGPNQAGAFICTLLPFFWGAARLLRARPWTLVTIVLLAELGLWFLLCKTYSRGALVAAATAGMLGWAWSFAATRRWQPARIDLFRLLAVAILLYSTGFLSRVEPDYVSSDRSAGNRILLWKGGLQMIGAAPWQGWGVGNSGSGFSHWFQPLEANEKYAGMVNSFLHVAVERGVPALAAVITVTAWIISFGVIAESRARAGGGNLRSALLKSAVLCIVSFCIANVFSTLWMVANLWWVPASSGFIVVLTGSALIRNDRLRRSWRALKAAIATAAGTLALLGLGYWILRPDLKIVPHSDGSIEVSKRQPDAHLRMVIVPDPSVLGDHWGKEVRMLVSHPRDRTIAAEAIPDLGAARDLLLGRPKWIVACGNNCARVLELSDQAADSVVILVHPYGKPPAIPSGNPAKPRVIVLFPRIETQSSSRAWKIHAKKNGWEQRMNEGVGQDARAVWPQCLLGVLD